MIGLALKYLLGAGLLISDTVGDTVQSPDVWYSPHFVTNGATPPDLFPLLNSPDTAWPRLAGRTSYFNLKMKILYATSSTDDELKALITTLKKLHIKVGVEIGGARWGIGTCNVTEVLASALREQSQVARWIKLGGSIDAATTDHANTWDVRGLLPEPPCVPAVPMATRIDAVAQVFASWRKFLGPKASLGFIESLGYWEIEGPDGTNFTNDDPVHLNNITGWIPRLEDVTTLLQAAAMKHNPTPGIPLLNHYQIDHGMDGVEHDTIRYGAVPPVGMNYGRILGAEAIMKAHGIQYGVFSNANPPHMRKYAPTPHSGCLVACDEVFTPSHSAALRTLNFTRGYMLLPTRSSQHVILEQWQGFPNVTGPEMVEDTGMWMASQAAAMVRAHGYMVVV